MKRWLSCTIFFFTSLVVSSQSREADSLRMALQNVKTDQGRVVLLCNLSYALQDSKPDSSLLLAQKAHFIAANIRYKEGEALSYSQMAAAYKSMGNFPKSLDYYIEQLKIEESIGDPVNLTNVYLAITSLYANSKEFDKALFYAKKADAIINSGKLENYAPYSLLNIGDVYEKKNMLDSAVAYTERSYAISVKAGNNLLIGTALNNLGNIYNKTGAYAKALAYYNEGIGYQTSSFDYTTYAESLLGKAKIFEHTGPADSAIFYGKKSFQIAAGNQFTVKALDASILLSALYKKNNNIDSAFFYQQTMVALKDSVYSQDKIKELQNITSAEQLRQAELEQLRLDEIKDRQIKLQFLIIGIAIPAFFLLSIFISRKKVHKRLIEFTGIVSVLLFFEFITLLLHPFIAEKSHHSPLIEIVIFVAIAAIITPTHHKIEHWLLKKLTAYNYLKHHRPSAEDKKNITEEIPEQS